MTSPSSAKGSVQNRLSSNNSTNPINSNTAGSLKRKHSNSKHNSGDQFASGNAISGDQEEHSEEEQEDAVKKKRPKLPPQKSSSNPSRINPNRRLYGFNSNSGVNSASSGSDEMGGIGLGHAANGSRGSRPKGAVADRVEGSMDEDEDEDEGEDDSSTAEDRRRAKGKGKASERGCGDLYLDDRNLDDDDDLNDVNPHTFNSNPSQGFGSGQYESQEFIFPEESSPQPSFIPSKPQGAAAPVAMSSQTGVKKPIQYNKIPTIKNEKLIWNYLGTETMNVLAVKVGTDLASKQITYVMKKHHALSESERSFHVEDAIGADRWANGTICRKEHKQKQSLLDSFIKAPSSKSVSATTASSFSSQSSNPFKSFNQGGGSFSGAPSNPGRRDLDILAFYDSNNKARSTSSSNRKATAPSSNTSSSDQSLRRPPLEGLFSSAVPDGRGSDVEMQDATTAVEKNTSKRILPSTNIQARQGSSSSNERVGRDLHQSTVGTSGRIGKNFEPRDSGKNFEPRDSTSRPSMISTTDSAARVNNSAGLAGGMMELDGNTSSSRMVTSNPNSAGPPLIRGATSSTATSRALPAFSSEKKAKRAGGASRIVHPISSGSEEDSDSNEALPSTSVKNKSSNNSNSIKNNSNSIKNDSTSSKNKSSNDSTSVNKNKSSNDSTSSKNKSDGSSSSKNKSSNDSTSSKNKTSNDSTSVNKNKSNDSFSKRQLPTNRRGGKPKSSKRKRAQDSDEELEEESDEEFEAEPIAKKQKKSSKSKGDDSSAKSAKLNSKGRKITNSTNFNFKASAVQEDNLAIMNRLLDGLGVKSLDRRSLSIQTVFARWMIVSGWSKTVHSMTLVQIRQVYVKVSNDHFGGYFPISPNGLKAKPNEFRPLSNCLKGDPELFKPSTPSGNRLVFCLVPKVAEELGFSSSAATSNATASGSNSNASTSNAASSGQQSIATLFKSSSGAGTVASSTISSKEEAWKFQNAPLKGLALREQLRNVIPDPGPKPKNNFGQASFPIDVVVPVAEKSISEFRKKGQLSAKEVHEFIETGVPAAKRYLANVRGMGCSRAVRDILDNNLICYQISAPNAAKNSPIYRLQPHFNLPESDVQTLLEKFPPPTISSISLKSPDGSWSKFDIPKDDLKDPGQLREISIKILDAKRELKKKFGLKSKSGAYSVKEDSTLDTEENLLIAVVLLFGYPDSVRRKAIKGGSETAGMGGGTTQEFLSCASSIIEGSSREHDFVWNSSWGLRLTVSLKKQVEFAQTFAGPPEQLPLLSSLVLQHVKLLNTSEPSALPSTSLIALQIKSVFAGFTKLSLEDSARVFEKLQRKKEKKEIEDRNAIISKRRAVRESSKA